MDSPYHRFQSLKFLRYTDRSILPIVRGDFPFPLDWNIYPTNICNHECVWCMFRQPAPDGHVEQVDARDTLPRELLLRAIDDAARTGAVIIHFAGGGEPLINKATAEAMARASAYGLKVSLSTNGRLLTPTIAGLVDYIRVSLNAGTAAQHLRTNHEGKGRGDWPIILDNIAAAIKVKRQDLGLAYVVDADNYADILPFCALAAELGVDFVHIRPAFYYDRVQDAAVRATMIKVLALTNYARLQYGHRVPIYSITEKFDNVWRPRSYNRCRAILTGTCLRATGDFAVCQDRTDLTFGRDPSYAEGARFEDVWHSPEHKAVVARIHGGPGGDLDACPRCVWNKRNELIEAIESDELRLALV